MDETQRIAEALGTYESIIGWNLVVGVALIAYWTLLEWGTTRSVRQRQSHRRRRRKHANGNRCYTPNTTPVVILLSSSDEKPSGVHSYCAIMFAVAVNEESLGVLNAPARLPKPLSYMIDYSHRTSPPNP